VRELFDLDDGAPAEADAADVDEDNVRPLKRWA
jgi:hypothetical protein